MIVHIVMFKFKDEDKEENILKTKLKLEMLADKIEELKFLEVGVNNDLKNYATHAEHLKVLNFIKNVTVESKVVDYEL